MKELTPPKTLKISWAFSDYLFGKIDHPVNLDLDIFDELYQEIGEHIE